MTITYQVKNAIYVNLTNRCPCACTFCLRNNSEGVYGSPRLWLEREPTLDEAISSIEEWDWATVLHGARELARASDRGFKELVFCGYGEPTERLDTLLATAEHMKKAHPAVRIRVNTNGLSDLINGRDTAPLFAGKVDCLSISLNTDDPAEYLAVCRPKFGEAAYPAMLKFTAEAAKCVESVVMTVVGEPVTSSEKQARCREIATRLGATLRVRPYEK